MKRNAKISLILIAAIIFSLVAFWDTDITYGSAKDPDVVLYVMGSSAQGGPMFIEQGSMGDGLWAPGVSKSGTMRIFNNYSQRVSVKSLGLVMKLEKRGEDGYSAVTDEALRELFAKSMKLTIKKGYLLVFSGSIYDLSFYEMLYEKDSSKYSGYQLAALDRFNIGKNDSVDLEYTVHMDERAGNELQGVRATVDFLVNVDENPEPPVPVVVDPGDGGSDYGGTTYTGPTIQKPEEVIPDVGGQWFHDCIVTLMGKGIIKGYPDKSIKPDEYITRAEAAALIGRALKLEDKTSGTYDYVDEIPGWAKGYIVSTSEKKIFIGYPGKLFKAEYNITREEMVAALIRAFNVKGTQNIELKFSDSGSIQKWALEYVKAGVEHNVLEGYPNNTFRPQGRITRAEVFTVICKLLGYHEEHAAKK